MPMKKTMTGDDTGVVKKLVRTTYLVVFVLQGCMFIYMSLMPYVFKKYGIDGVEYGYIQSGYAATQLLMSVGVGWFGDAYGAKAVLCLAAVSSFLGHGISGIAWSASLVILSRVASVFQDSMPGAQMVVADIVPEKDRSDALGKLMLPMSFGLILGPVISGIMAKYFGEQNTYLIVSLLPALILFFIIVKFPSDTKSIGESSTKSAKKPGVSWQKVKELVKGDVPFLLIIKLCTALPGMTFFMNFAVIGMKLFNLTPQFNGVIGACMGLTMIIVNGFIIGRLSKKFGSEKLIKWCPPLLLIVYFLMINATELWQVIVVQCFWLLPYNILDNQITTQLTKVVPKSETGSMLGINTAVFHLSRTLAPVIGALIMDKYGFSSFGYFGLLVTLLSVTIVFTRSPPKPKEE